jgi:hypothetical protein
MNTANLQLEGVYTVLAALLNAVRKKGLLNEDEIESLLTNVETALATDPNRPAEVRNANVEAICFPTRFLRLALQSASQGEVLSFAQLASKVGLTKPQRHDGVAG